MKANLSEIMESIQGEGLLIGSRQVFLRFTGCNLRCDYCDTLSSLKKVDKCKIYLQTGSRNIEKNLNNPIGSGQVKQVLKAYTSSWISLTGGEPLLWSSFIAELGSILKPLGYRFLLETNATLYEELDICLPYLDIISMDIKLPSATGQDCWDMHERFLLKAGKLKKYIKIVITRSSTFQELGTAFNIIRDIDRSIPVILQPVTLHNLCSAPEWEVLLKMQSLGLKSLDNVRVLPQLHPLIGLI